jgi:hypothetical protein
MSGAIKAACKSGHPYKQHGVRDSNGKLVCLPCRRKYQREWWLRKRGMIAPALVKAGVSQQSIGTTIGWAKRRERIGPSGWSESAKARYRATRKLQAKQRRWCRKKLHRWETGRRQCRLCYNARMRLRLATKRQKADIAPFRDAMIKAGIKSNQQPDSAYWRARYEAAIARWQKLKQAA